MKVSTKLFAQVERYVRLEMVDKLSVVTSTLVVAGVVFALGASAVFFLSTALVEAISLIVGNKAVAYLLVGVLLLLLIWLFLANKKSWVEDRVVRNISESVLSEPMIIGDEEDLEDIYDDDPQKGGAV